MSHDPAPGPDAAPPAEPTAGAARTRRRGLLGALLGTATAAVVASPATAAEEDPGEHVIDGGRP